VLNDPIHSGDKPMPDTLRALLRQMSATRAIENAMI